jgi:hypothetical protein
MTRYLAKLPGESQEFEFEEETQADVFVQFAKQVPFPVELVAIRQDRVGCRYRVYELNSRGRVVVASQTPSGNTLW